MSGEATPCSRGDCRPEALERKRRSLGSFPFRTLASKQVSIRVIEIHTEATVSTRIDEILKRLPNLPDSAVVPTAVAAAHDNVSDRTVRRTYPLIKLSPGRYGVRVGYLRHRGELTASPTAA